MRQVMSVLDTDKLKIYRLKRRMNQRSLAEAVGIAANYYSEIETGKKTPSLETLVDIVRALKLNGVDCVLKKQSKSGHTSK